MPIPGFGFSSSRDGVAAAFDSFLRNPRHDAAAADLPQTGADDLGLLAVDRNRRERDMAAIERAVAALRMAKPAFDCWSEPPVTNRGCRRAPRLLRGARRFTAAIAAGACRRLPAAACGFRLAGK